MSNLDNNESFVTSVSDDVINNKQTTFSDLPLPASLLEILAEHNFVNPTPIQAQSIPHVLAGKDMQGIAQTGTGKTLAFALPIVAQLLANPEARVMVLVPTRELAQQVTKTFNLLVKKNKSLRTTLLIGGEYIRQQMTELSKNPRIIIGTPGRVIDHLERGTLALAEVKYLILDEMDRMLDMGFGLQLDEILSYLPKERQTLMFSATLPGHISKIAQRYLRNPVLVSIGQHSQPVAKIKQDVVFVKQTEKLTALVEALNARQESKAKGSVIIFVRTKMDADDICEQLRDQRFRASAMHGDLRQAKRQRVLNDFRTRKLDILVATDIAARGIDIAHIELVINYELPQATEDYVHRIGRTARGGAEGSALSFVAPFEQGKWRDILRLTNPEAAKEFMVKRPQRTSDKPFKKFGGGEERRSFGGERRSFGGERRAFGGGEDRRSFGGERRAFGGGEERRSFGGERRSSDGDQKRSYFADRDNAEGQKRGGFERRDRDFNGERRDSSRNDSQERRFGDRGGFGGRPNAERRFKSDRPERDGERR
ncbi:DEAD/DEAH box helicase, partial [bacterium]|nr:DEAD/DEAH box helicase [bacterium]